MAFTQPCFIRKNTPELRKKLEELGYNRYPRWMADWSDDDSRYTYLVADVLYYTYPKEPTKPKNGEYIDCGTNEELFLALAALRDDSDYMQWFVSQAEKDSPKVFIKSTTHSCAESLAYTHRWDWRCSKATVEEIIEHFKDK